MLRRVLLGILMLGAVAVASAQSDVLNRKVTIKIKKKSIPEILKEIESSAKVSFNYNTKIIPTGKFSIQANNEELSVVLVNLLSPHKLTFSVLFGNHIVISKIEKKVHKFTVSGYVIDENSGERLIGVSVYNQYTLKGTHTNQDGYYSLTLNSDSVNLVYSLFPYTAKSKSFYLNSHSIVNMSLRDDVEFPNFTVSSKPDNQLNYKPDNINMSSRTMKQLPVLFGETDVMKGLQLLPGVSSGSDGTIGLNIRGGGPDQNLILLDDVPIYNPSHIFGFFSIFNSDIIKDVRLIKGGTSARYSGRLSSVIDVRTLDGNTKKIKFQASLGVLSSKLTIDGPVGKSKKTTFILSGRRSYIDLFNSLEWSPLLSSEYSPLKTGYYFFDANGKVNHKFNDKHQLSINFYSGQDNLFIRNSFSIKDPEKEITEKDKQTVFWGNRLISLRDHHVWSPKLSAWLNISYTSYDFGNESNYEYAEDTDSQQIANSYNYRFVSRIRNSIFSYNLDYKHADWLAIKGGAGFVLHEFNREISSSDNIVNKSQFENNTLKANELNSYLELNWKIRRKLMINTGVHFVNYNVSGNPYPIFQPRLSINYKLRKNWLFHGAYQNTAQFLHLLTSTTAGIPIDLWLPSTRSISPESSDLFSAGVSYMKGDFVVNVEAFNRKMYNVIDYKEQANYIGVYSDWEQKVTAGTGLAYGYELLIEKRNGRTKGWASYTLSWNNRKFDQINGGNAFPYRYDRRHNFAFFISHDFNKKIDASMSWVYTSGARYTLPEQVYYLNSGLSPNNIIYIYGERNNYRFPNYHRMDLGVNFKKIKEKYTRYLSLGAYNVYNRLNPFYITPTYDKSGNRIFEAVSLFPFIPSINYKIVF